MHLSAVVVSLLLGVASAQKVTVVQVSNSSNALIYSPDNIKVSAGDMVQFQFMAGNHTVTQSTFDQPCQPVALSSNATGFHSGFVPFAASQASGMIPTYTIMVNDTKPIWVYCAQAKHCENGMVMVINENTSANASRSLQAFKELAANSSTVVPGSSDTSGGTTGSTTGSSTGTTTGSTTGSTGAAGSAGTMVKASSALSLLAVAAALAAL
ncbi:hypothetical protein NKR23_g3975 [Pleurostoma richardsiae]|uniref:Extracellular serine-rich protein n=1 Tax=Pleurostoma richardsiae TaxID=41990 RepID=A0AA38RXG9_9PEZI|nr:hypothetical protein NKR23_g3975 [Pleurostoma richardsiae]